MAWQIDSEQFRRKMNGSTKRQNRTFLNGNESVTATACSAELTGGALLFHIPDVLARHRFGLRYLRPTYM